MPNKNPMLADKVVLKNGGTIETEAGTAIISVSSGGTATITGTETVIASEIALAQNNILVGNASGVAAAAAINTSVTGQALTGFVAGAGAISASDTVLTGFNKTAARLIALEALGVGGALADGNIIVGSGAGVAASVNPSGDVDVSNTGVFSIGANKVVTSMILDGNVTAAKVANTTGISELGVLKIANVVYDFAVDGGVAGTIVLTGAPTIPDNACCMLIGWDVITTCTSATDAATIALQLPTDGLLNTAVAISAGTNTWDAGYTGSFTTGMLPKKTTAARVPSLLVAGGENLTAGKIVFHIQYWISA